MPEEGLNQPGMTNLLEHLAAQAGAWGAFHLLAEIEESSLALEGLRRSGFSVYAWQHIWKYTASSENSSLNGASNARRMDQQAGPLRQVSMRSVSATCTNLLCRRLFNQQNHSPRAGFLVGCIGKKVKFWLMLRESMGRKVPTCSH